MRAKRGKGLVIRRGARHWRLAIDRSALDGLDIDRRGHVIDDGVKERLDALVLEGGTRDDRYEGALKRALADELLEFDRRRLLTLKGWVRVVQGVAGTGRSAVATSGLGVGRRGVG
eukprot:scaffold209589_cov35-Tisochrysis_lutea.AAC.4